MVQIMVNLDFKMCFFLNRDLDCMAFMDYCFSLGGTVALHLKLGRKQKKKNPTKSEFPSKTPKEGVTTLKTNTPLLQHSQLFLRYQNNCGFFG